jgi:hypothetical protein
MLDDSEVDLIINGSIEEIQKYTEKLKASQAFNIFENNYKKLKTSDWKIINFEKEFDSMSNDNLQIKDYVEREIDIVPFLVTVFPNDSNLKFLNTNLENNRIENVLDFSPRKKIIQSDQQRNLELQLRSCFEEISESNLFRCKEDHFKNLYLISEIETVLNLYKKVF